MEFVISMVVIAGGFFFAGWTLGSWHEERRALAEWWEERARTATAQPNAALLRAIEAGALARERTGPSPARTKH